MKIVKSFDTKRFKLLSDAIDSTITEMGHPWHFDRMVFFLSKSEFAKADEESAAIFIDIKSVDDDERFVKAYIHRLLTYLACSLRGSLTGNDIIDCIITNREVIRKGLGDELFYYYYISLNRKKKAGGYGEFIHMNIPWISFAGSDAHYSDFLRESVDRMKYRKAFQQRAKKLFDALSGGLSDDKIAQAERMCKRIKW